MEGHSLLKEKKNCCLKYKNSLGLGKLHILFIGLRGWWLEQEMSCPGTLLLLLALFASLSIFILKLSRALVGDRERPVQVCWAVCRDHTGWSSDCSQGLCGMWTMDSWDSSTVERYQLPFKPEVFKTPVPVAERTLWGFFLWIPTLLELGDPISQYLYRSAFRDALSMPWFLTSRPAGVSSDLLIRYLC